jgi:hypothetical protein
MPDLSPLEMFLAVVTLLTTTGMVVTAKDFYSLKDDLDKRYVLKEVHNSEILALKEDISEVKSSQEAVQETVTKIYNFLLSHYGGEHGCL